MKTRALLLAAMATVTGCGLSEEDVKQRAAEALNGRDICDVGLDDLGWVTICADGLTAECRGPVGCVIAFDMEPYYVECVTTCGASAASSDAK